MNVKVHKICGALFDVSKDAYNHEMKVGMILTACLTLHEINA